MTPSTKDIHILSINAGSSSVKLSLYAVKSSGDRNSPQLLIESSISGLTSPPAKFTYTHHDALSNSDSAEDINKKELDKEQFSHNEAFEYFLDHLSKDPSVEGVSSREDIHYVCHRIVHGGKYDKAVTINSETTKYIKELTDLAPLHNAPALAIVKSCLEQFPKTQNIAHFDSAFHFTMPDYIQTYALDLQTSKERKIRKYGFHGISYQFITRSVAEFLGKDISDLNIIALHLGSGASACAIRKGKSLDNSMGLTPLEGLPGATRSGTVDPSLVFHYTSNADSISHSSTAEMHISKAEEILNKKSGWKALTGTTDFSTITEKAESTSDEDQKYKLALDIFTDRIVAYVGSYYVKLGGKVDALVFSGGIGEKSAVLRKRVVSDVACLGFKIVEDGGENIADSSEANVVFDISCSTPIEGRSKRVLVCKTDEQFEMARNCAKEWVSIKT